ncbi:TRAP transporter small permease [Variovorax fucosicus]|uniref:TRAP transporter small permease n=1 Tax=Variovorax fucosicus TaxID=3053517 RepID=UPI0025757608|nr:TRAP transporter small permease [Variovorax sp. J22G47]MDM0058646.1 TRAP transporter small permease [Variovorax sp. J22G47]
MTSAVTTVPVADAAPGEPITLEDIHVTAPRPPSNNAYSRFCAFLSKMSLMLAVVLLITIIVCVQYQVVGRYIFNDTPTWAEGLALQLVLYVTALGVAVGVRDAGHIGFDTLVEMLPEWLRLKAHVLIHLLVALFSGIMAWSGWVWTQLKWTDIKPMMGVPVGLDYLALVVAGILMVMFSIEHIVALLRDEEVVPAWN